VVAIRREARVILDGRALAERIREAHAPEVEALARAGRRPRLVSFQVGRHEAVDAYVRGQRRGAEAWHVEYDARTLAETATEAEVRAALDAAAADPAVTGILLQLPLPPHLSARALQRSVPPRKDVEGVHPENLGGVVTGSEGPAPCTALAAVALLESSGATLSGAEAVVVGHSRIVGRPVALMLLARDATTTVCHVHTRDLAAHTRRADVLVVAVGRPHLVTADMVKPGAVVVDVGINAVPVPGEPGRTRLVGDVDTEALLRIGCRVSPVPGGVGPVTVAMLLRNTVLVAREPAAADSPPRYPPFRHLD
jgi:methylenetetrahydrofolate dehydrogenase (NADP+)/methenyltetrahydrofolate cyclohydrolase